MGATTIEYLVYLARLVLENYYFEFDEKIFRQKLGTAMHRDQVRTMFCEYIYLWVTWKKNFLDTCELIKQALRWRFLDDIFVIWLHSEEELNNFLLRLNSFHENIKYTWDISYHRIYFLDVSVGLDNDFFLY